MVQEVGSFKMKSWALSTLWTEVIITNRHHRHCPSVRGNTYWALTVCQPGSWRVWCARWVTRTKKQPWAQLPRRNKACRSLVVPEDVDRARQPTAFPVPSAVEVFVFVPERPSQLVRVKAGQKL